MPQPRLMFTVLQAAAAAFFSCALPVQLSAQAIFPPTQDPQSNDKGCLGHSKMMREDDVEFETYMTSAVSLSVKERRVTLPLFKGIDSHGGPVYYILTESSDCAEAQARNINYAPKLGLLIDANGAPKNAAVQSVAVDSRGTIQFPGTVDFSPIRIFTPSAGGWPPDASTAGSKGDSLYTPFITYKNAKGKYVVFNASQVMNNTGIKDFVPEVDLVHMTATFDLVMGIYDFNFLMYLRMDASFDLVSGFEGGVYAPNPNLAPGNGLRLLAEGSARQTIMPIVNGIQGTDKIYERQGLVSSALGEGDPLNVLGAKPGDDEYSPIWDITPVVWTQEAINGGKRQRLHQDDEVLAFLQKGYLTSATPPPGTTPAGVTPLVNHELGIQSFGIVSNCPVMIRVMKGMLPYDPAHPDK